MTTQLDGHANATSIVSNQFVYHRALNGEIKSPVMRRVE